MKKGLGFYLNDLTVEMFLVISSIRGKKIAPAKVKKKKKSVEKNVFL